MGEVILHVGVAKSGTTFLQRMIFNQVPTVVFLGQPYESRDFRQSVESLKRDDEYEYDEKKLLQILTPYIEKAKISERYLLFSDETITSPDMKTEVAHRLHSLFGGARILITIRDQISSVESYYSKHGRILKKVPAPWSGQFVEFDDWFNFYFNNPRGFHFDRIDYKKIYQIYASIFGEKNVIILPYEAMVRKESIFVTELSSLLNCQPELLWKLLNQPAVNARSSNVERVYHRWRAKFGLGKSLLGGLPITEAQRNRLRKFIQDRLSKSTGPDNFKLPVYAKEQIMARYADGNRWLAERTGIDLKSYGYATEDANHNYAKEKEV